ncbi:MAG TPA: glycosyltransferase family 2 protein [Abditibacteriaceae bacterium]|jgi:cellulose synthase/poly-beta-1,6-N-acetylglucosamine synthase-like glycosyltransferase
MNFRILITLLCLLGVGSHLPAQERAATPAQRPATPTRARVENAARETQSTLKTKSAQAEAAMEERLRERQADATGPIRGRGTSVAPYVWRYAPPNRHPIVLVLIFILFLFCFIICMYGVRHYLFTYNRLFGKQRHPYIDVDAADWPSVTLLIAAHNEESVIEGILSAVMDVDYPADKLTVMPVNDRSTDRTREIVDGWVARYPMQIKPFHREKGAPGKGAALRDATELVRDEIIIVFDADYIPGRGLIKQLVAPFFDPEVGAVMGRVVPGNVGANLLTRLLDLERSAGYQVDQQARMNMHMVPQYAGTVGGVRMSALKSVGGWGENALTEDTDLTYKMMLQNWITVYQNRSECYEEVPEEWPVRIRQIMRWARGHNSCLRSYIIPVLTSRHISMRQRWDGIMLLGVYMLSPMILIGCLIALTLFYLGANPLFGVLAVFSVAAYGTLGNFATFFEVAAAARLDGSRNRIRLLPLNMFGYLVNTISVSRSWIGVLKARQKSGVVWDKTARYRKGNTQ